MKNAIELSELPESDLDEVSGGLYGPKHGEIAYQDGKEIGRVDAVPVDVFTHDK